RRPFELVLGTRAEVVGLEPPRHLELVEVGGVDLIERRVLRAAHIGGVVRPVAFLRARLTRCLSADEDARDDDDRDEQPRVASHRRGLSEVSDVSDPSCIPTAGSWVAARLTAD